MVHSTYGMGRGHDIVSNLYLLDSDLFVFWLLETIEVSK